MPDSERPFARATEDAPRPWHALDAQAAAEELGVSTSVGLTSAEAAARLAADGPNELAAESGPTIPQLILAQVANPMVYLLAGAGVVSLLAGKVFDAVVIVLIVIANVVIGVFQEYRAEAALDALRKLSSPRARVLRDGEVRVIEAAQVVVGDILVLETGDRVGADARILAETDLRVDESALTGESEPIDKSVEPLAESAPLADRVCMVYSSTPVVAGRAAALVVATGMATVVGEIAGDVRSTQRQDTPLQGRLAKLSVRLGILSVVAAVVIFVLGVFRGESVVDMALFAVAAAVSAIPEGLPTAVSVSLALGVQRMAKRNAVVRRLAAVETLGGCTVVCTDKTGTLTRNEMTVTRLWAGGERFDVTGDGYSPEGEIVPDPGQTEVFWSDVELLLEVGCTANNALLESDEAGRWIIEGNPTDGAVMVAASKGGALPGGTRCDGSRIDEIPFSSSFKYMATLDARAGGGRRLHVKGAPDRVLGYCDRLLLDGEVVELTEELRDVGATGPGRLLR